MDVLVAGAGIAGLSAGMAMTKAGHRVVIAERAGDLREIGAALSIWPNAMAALDLLGVGEQVRVVGVEAPTASIRARTGAPIVHFHADAMQRALGGLPVVVLRAGLQAALLGACSGLGIEIRLGQTVEAVRAEGVGVTVTTGTGQQRYDAVIGADGINSRVRAAVTDGGEARDCDRVAWRALIPDPGGLGGSDAWLTVGVGLQLIASPAPEHLVYWAADTPGSDMPLAAGEPPDLLGVLHRRFGSWPHPIPRLIEATPPDALIVNRVSDRRPPRNLHRGRVLLVGDAAHAMTPDLGQGACQAIEDAAVLLACARRRPGAGPADLFAEFERTRLPRVRRIVRDSYAIGRVAVTPSPLGAGARDALTRLLPESLTNRRLATYASAAAFERHLERATA